MRAPLRWTGTGDLPRKILVALINNFSMRSGWVWVLWLMAGLLGWRKSDSGPSSAESSWTYTTPDTKVGCHISVGEDIFRIAGNTKSDLQAEWHKL